MRWRVILGLSVTANLFLALGWVWSERAQTRHAAQTAAGTNSNTSTNVRTAVVVRRQFFSWQELESRDYPTYIKNLRDIGCPEQTIRDIIIADVTQVLREKYLGQAPRLKPNPKWWTNHRDATTDDPQANQANTMAAERSAILSQLLGPDWAVRSQSPVAATNNYQAFVLATLEVNPVLQSLSAEKKQAIAAVLGQPAQARTNSASTTSAAAASPDNGDSAQLLAETKARWVQLSEILSPDQLEAVKLHLSNHADSLRNEFDALPGFNAQPEEFRKIFQATEAIDEQFLALEDDPSAEAQQQREKLQHNRDAAIRTALEPNRYEQYARLNDPAYLSAMESVADGRGNDTAVALLYAINREAASEQQRIENDPTLTDTQREIELKRLELEKLKTTAEALGEELLDEPGKAPPPRPEPRRVHAVAEGESLERIARIYGVDVNGLRAANPGLNFDKLPAGTSVNVPLRLMYPLPPPN